MLLGLILFFRQNQNIQFHFQKDKSVKILSSFSASNYDGTLGQKGVSLLERFAFFERFNLSRFLIVVLVIQTSWCGSSELVYPVQFLLFSKGGT